MPLDDAQTAWIIEQQPPAIISTINSEGTEHPFIKEYDISETLFYIDEMNYAWKIAHTSDSGTVYYIRMKEVGSGKKGNRFAWIKEDYRRNKNYKTSYSLNYTEFDCQNGGAATKRTIQFFRDGREASRSDYPDATLMQSAIIDAPSYKLELLFCEGV